MRDGVVLISDEAFYFTLLLQITAYSAVAVVLLLIKLKNFRKPKRKSEGDEEERYSIGKKFVVGSRICVSAGLSATGMLFGAKALMLYDNLAVLAMLPVSRFLR
jgi:hypothetical protein